MIFPYQEDIRPFFSACDGIILPSRSEIFPLVLVEAMMCGKPAIVTNVGDIGCWVSTEEAIILQDSTAEVLSDAIFLFASNPKLRNTISEAALKKSQMFTAEHMVSEIFSCIL